MRILATAPSLQSRASPRCAGGTASRGLLSRNHNRCVVVLLMIQGVLAFYEGRMPETRINQQRAAVDIASCSHLRVVPSSTCVANVAGPLLIANRGLDPSYTTERTLGSFRRRPPPTRRTSRGLGGLGA
jgi:hypothetical protein